jgi:hypothetical protein
MPSCAIDHTSDYVILAPPGSTRGAGFAGLQIIEVVGLEIVEVVALF